MSKQQMKLEVTTLDGGLLGSLEFEAPENYKINFYVRLPERSPLHENALNMDDLKVGMSIQLHYGSGWFCSALINGVPFRRGTKYHDPRDTQGDAWMIPVVRTHYTGKLVHEDWFLNEMGVTPYEHPDGGSHWNEQNYTLAVG